MEKKWRLLTKLKVEVLYEENKSNENGKVLKQSIESGKTVDVETTVVITVNKIIENKTATITVDLKSITGGYKDKEEGSTNTTSTQDVVKTATVIIKVNGEVKEQASNVDKNKTVKKDVSGTGSVQVEVEITDTKGGKWIKTHTLDLTKETAYTFQ